MIPMSWSQRVVGALVLLLAVALGARAIHDLLAPLVPAVMVLVVLYAIGWFILRRRR